MLGEEYVLPPVGCEYGEGDCAQGRASEARSKSEPGSRQDNPSSILNTLVGSDPYGKGKADLKIHVGAETNPQKIK